MWRWVILAFAVLFIISRLARLQPSPRDKKLQLMRQAATQAGLAVRFWTKRNSGYQSRLLPESGFMYYFPWPVSDQPKKHWAIWLDVEGNTHGIAGEVPDLAQKCLYSFQQNFPNSWALLECNAVGMGLLWQECGELDDVNKIAQALDVLRKNFDVVTS